MKVKLWMGAAALGFSLLATAATAQTVDQRHYHQQHRVAEGVHSGQLTRHEYNRVEHQQRSIDRQEAHMRWRHHGHLTRHDRAVLRHRENRASDRIYRDKHNHRVS
jgi:hypothetical protein